MNNTATTNGTCRYDLNFSRLGMDTLSLTAIGVYMRAVIRMKGNWLKVGDQDSTRELARFFQVNKASVRGYIQELKDAGLIVCIDGQYLINPRSAHIGEFPKHTDELFQEHLRKV